MPSALDTTEPFGSGPKAPPAAVAHLGYLQIDTIYVIERSHHHILYTRIPTYRREHLHQAQSIDKTVFEYWTHALSYVPTESLRFYVRHMRQDWQRRNVWFGKVSNGDLRRVLSRIRRHGALHHPRHRGRAGGKRLRVGQPQAFQARSGAGLLQGLGDD